MVFELISVDEKRQALERVVASRTFSRSDQLRSFLRFVCEAEFEGRAQELNEYVLGVSVLGRPSDYSPAEDSCVRTRAYELRNKLKSYYGLEAPDDPVQIQIRKGAYVPQFQRSAVKPPVVRTEVVGEISPLAEPAEATAVVAPETAPEVPAATRVASGKRRSAGFVVLAVVLAATLGATGYVIRDKQGAGSTSAAVWTPEMTALWKPFLNESTPLVIAFEVRFFFFSPSTGLVVRDYQTNDVDELGKSKPLSVFEQKMNASDLQPNSDYADSGAVPASFLLGQLLGPQHRAIGLKHAKSLGWDDLWNSNVVFIGKPDVNPAIRYNLKGADFTDDATGIVRNVHPQPSESAEYRSATTHGSGVKYALISVLPGPQSGHHVMILSGSGSEFLWALAQYVSDPIHVKELVSHLRLPSGEMPPAFQVVIEATFESGVPIKIRYVTHRVAKGV